MVKRNRTEVHTLIYKTLHRKPKIEQHESLEFVICVSSACYIFKSLQQMLRYLAASGHNLYVKCAHVYLQDMLELEQTHPNLDAAFKSGLHVVRRTYKLCPEAARYRSICWRLFKWRSQCPDLSAVVNWRNKSIIFIYSIQSHPNLDAAFKSGLHVVRRSDRFCTGLSTDLVIEQALMRSIKSIGKYVI
jgi:hypothetical protein